MIGPIVSPDVAPGMPVLETWAQLTAFSEGLAATKKFGGVRTTYLASLQNLTAPNLAYWRGAFTGLWISQLTEYQKEVVLRVYTMKRIER